MLDTPKFFWIFTANFNLKKLTHVKIHFVEVLHQKELGGIYNIIISVLKFNQMIVLFQVII